MPPGQGERLSDVSGLDRAQPETVAEELAEELSQSSMILEDEHGAALGLLGWMLGGTA